MKTCKKCGHAYEPGKRCMVCKNAYTRQWARKNRDKVNAGKRRYYDANPGLLAEERKRFKANNPGYYNEYMLTRSKTDPLFKLANNTRSLVYKAHKCQGYTKSSKTTAILGCSFEEFEAHLIQTAMKNYGYWTVFNEYHIDHIVPVSSATTKEELLRLNHYSNLQYLYPKDNMSKSDTLNWSLQSDTSVPEDERR
jgi:hypothetical protein